ncbi:type II secretion system protein GspL [Sphingomonas sp. H39-1-10]|uniref:type II secretion system protein GspL n=1 Tax=Sphingomonas pollutisoli TaxID=3030829 RepID=UPI0023B99670|nr:type II secretion system protein GspL [Sphingomonas pollutisoli]MDF0489536.1 type II secretion system protein GspL [Sphingomonas pollutisoli]
MSETLILFLPSGTAPWRWLRVSGGVVAARGEGVPALTPEATPLVVTPADAVTLHWAELPDRSAAQAVTAARILAAEASAAPLNDLHVAVGREGSGSERPIGVVALSRMRGWLDMLAANGVDAGALLPAPLLLPRPESGFVAADLGGETIVRGATTGFADEAGLTELLTGGVAPERLEGAGLDAAIVAAVAAPALDLRQGVFARRTRFAIDWALVRRLGWLGLAILGASLAISVVRIVKYDVAAADLERRADLAARAGLPQGETVNDADRQLDARLVRLRGPGLGFSRTAATVFSAVRAVRGAEVTNLAFASDGTLRVGIAAEGERAVTDLQQRLRAAGLTVDPGAALTASGGRVTGTLTVKPR